MRDKDIAKGGAAQSLSLLLMPVFVQVYPVIVILNAVKNPCILPEVP
jgi:hypothetical protein